MPLRVATASQLAMTTPSQRCSRRIIRSEGPLPPEGERAAVAGEIDIRALEGLGLCEVSKVVLVQQVLDRHRKHPVVRLPAHEGIGQGVAVEVGGVRGRTGTVEAPVL